MDDLQQDELQALEQTLKIAALIRPSPAPETNFFEVGGAGYLERPTSTLMALFMGAQNPVPPPWLAKALVACMRDVEAVDDSFDLDWANVTVETEVAVRGEADSMKYVDILITDGTSVVGIENKVWAPLNNPLAAYDRLLEERVGAGGKIAKCILQSYLRNGATPDWPVLTYAELTAKAIELYGRDVLAAPLNKWSVFYQEFLHHMNRLAGQERMSQMNEENTQFVVQHFDQLKKAVTLLDAFEKDLSNDGKRAIAEALSEGEEIAVRTGFSTWSNGNTRGLRFFPGTWNGRSHIAIYFYADRAYGENGSIGYGVCAYIPGRGKEDFNEIVTTFNKTIVKGKGKSLSPREEPVLYEEGGKLLCLDCYPFPYTRDGVLAGAKELAVWVQNNVFDRA
jgi:hypothetical protein